MLPPKSATRRGGRRNSRSAGSNRGGRVASATIVVLANIVGYLGFVVAMVGMCVTMLVFLSGQSVAGLMLGGTSALIGAGSTLARGVGPFFGGRNPNDGIGLRALGIALTVLGVFFIPMMVFVLDALGVPAPE